MSERKLILVTNDDGYKAEGINNLTEVARKFGDVVVVAPEEGQSGMSHAITIKTPLRLRKIHQEDGLKILACNGTPVDCVKLALNQVVDRVPDLVLSGINHGSNASVSVIYSGTMAAAIEGSMNGIKSIGFSILDLSSSPDFDATKFYASQIIEKTLEETKNICLNVNIPIAKKEEIKGVRMGRQAKGAWKEEFEKRMDTRGKEYYWLTGYFENYEPNADDTDEWALANNYVSIVPVHTDLTKHEKIKALKDWAL